MITVLGQDLKVGDTMEYETSTRADFGRCATQIKVWKTIDPATVSLASEVFFGIMLAEFETMISDRTHTAEGRKFWLLRMAEAIAKGMRVGMLDYGKMIEYDPSQSWNGWLAKVDGWGTLSDHHDRLFYISRIPASAIS